MKLLLCASCRSHDLSLTIFKSFEEGGVVADGVITCDACHTSYKVEDGLPELILRQPQCFTLDNEFTRRYATELADLSLTRPAPSTGREVDEHKIGQAAIFDEIVKIYEGMTESHFWRAVDRHVFGLWGEDLSRHSMLLEVGCGNGRISRPMATGNTTVVGVDISRGMLKKAIKTAEEEGNQSIHYLMGDAENMPLRSEIFDACLIYGVLHHLNSPPDCLKEVGRVLEPGGHFYALENNRSVFRWMFDVLVKVKKLWEEHASNHYVMSQAEVKAWGRNASLDLTTSTMVYLPPQLANPLGGKGAVLALRLTEKLFGSLPFFRNHGGLLYIRGTRSRNNSTQQSL